MPSLEVYFLKTKSFVGMTSFELCFRTEQMSKYVSVLEKGFIFFNIGETNVEKGKEKNPIVLDLSERHQCELLTSTEHIFTRWV